MRRLGRGLRPLLAGLLLVVAGAQAQPLPAQPAVAEALLARLMVLARARDPALQAAEAGAQAAVERLEQARAALRPTLNASLGRSHMRTTNLDEAPLLSTSPTDNYSTQQALQLSWPLWRPQLHSGRTQAEMQARAAELQRAVALQDLAGRLVAAVLDVLNAQEQLAQVQAQKQATAEQMAVARRSFTVGTVSITDVREAEAKFDAVLAQEAAGQYDLQARRAALQELVGAQESLPEPLGALTAQADMPALLGPELPAWLERAETEHPALRQSRLQVQAAELEIDKAQQGHQPTLDLSASETRTHSNTASLLSAGNTRATSAGLTLTVPLYAGGGVSARQREAVALRQKAEAELETARQTVRGNVRQAHYATLSALAQVRALATAEQSAQTALRANRRGYEVGMRINADVLAAQSQLYQTRRDLARARHEAWLQYIRLIVAAGVLEPGDLARLDAQIAPGGPGVPKATGQN